MPHLVCALLANVVVAASPSAAALVVRGTQATAIEAEMRAVLEFVPDLELESAPSTLGQNATSCGSDADCIARFVAAAKLDFAVIAAAAPGNGTVGLAIQIVDARGLDRHAKHFETIDVNTSSLRRGVADAVRRSLEKAGFELGGRVTITSEPAIATVTTGQRRSVGRLATALPPGEHTVRIEHPDYRTHERRLTIREGEEQSVFVELEERHSILASPWLWIGIGVVVAAGATTALVAGRRDTVNQLCVVPNAGASCDR